MLTTLTLIAIVIVACVLCNKLTNKIGVPMLLAFILLGVLFGSDGLFKIPFDDFKFVEQVCTVALIFIMFYGGFGTSWKKARPVAPKAMLLSSAGVLITAVLVGGVLSLYSTFPVAGKPSGRGSPWVHGCSLSILRSALQTPELKIRHRLSAGTGERQQ